MVIVSFCTGRPQVAEVMFLTAGIHGQSQMARSNLTTYLPRDSITVQLSFTQEVTRFSNPPSKQRHVWFVDEHSDCGKEAARHSSCATVGQHSVLHIDSTS